MYAEAVSVAGISQMGTPKGQRRAAERISRAMGGALLDIRLAPEKRGKFILRTVDFGLWSPIGDRLMSDIEPSERLA